jgi:hypothetical protein
VALPQGSGSKSLLVLSRTPGAAPPSKAALQAVQQLVLRELGLQQKGAAAGTGVGPAGMAAPAAGGGGGGGGGGSR